MEQVFMEHTIQAIILCLVLIILGLLLKKWQPPIKEQYVFSILAIIGSTLGYYILKLEYGFLWGFIGAGLVFYKDELLKEAKDVKDVLAQAGQLKTKEEEEEEEE